MLTKMKKLSFIMKNIHSIIVLLGLFAHQTFSQATWELTPKGIVYPRYADANRPVAPLTIGTTIFNTSQNTHQYWNGSGWTNVSTPGGGGGPWSAVGNSIYNNTGNRVGINTANPSADLEIQGGSGLLVSSLYAVTTSTPTNTYTMPYNGTLAIITDNAGRVLDPGGNGNFLTNTSYASYIKLQPSTLTDGFRFTFESLDLGGSTIIFSTSSDVNNIGAYILFIDAGSNYATGRPFTINEYDVIYIHNKIISGGTAAAGFQLLFESLAISTTNTLFSESIGVGLSFNRLTGSFASGSSKARGSSSNAMGYASSASGNYSTAIGYSSTASGNLSTAMGVYGNTNGKYASFSIGVASPSRATNDKANQMKMHFDEFKFLTGTSRDFTITDGQITTSNTISVFGVLNNTISNYGYLSNTAPTGIYTGSVTIPYSIYATSRVLGLEFDAFSDARHKKLRSYSNGKTDLSLLNQLKVSNYTFIDTVGKGTKMQMGFIAQQVEAIVPEAVNRIQDYIPNVYDMAKSMVYDANAHTLSVTTKKPHDFQAKDEIKLISLEKEHKVKADKIIDTHTFVVSNWEKSIDKLFVFGKRVDDFRTVDYDRLFTLGISSIQELSRKIDALEQENLLLKAKNVEFNKLKNDVAELKAMLLK